MTEELNNIKNGSSKNLAGYIITYRLLGIYKDRSILCMEELMRRKNAGDDFNFEEYIELELKSCPQPSDLTKISSLLKGLI